MFIYFLMHCTNYLYSSRLQYLYFHTILEVFSRLEKKRKKKKRLCTNCFDQNCDWLEKQNSTPCLTPTPLHAGGGARWRGHVKVVVASWLGPVGDAMPWMDVGSCMSRPTHT
jgi:hypothetical protein